MVASTVHPLPGRGTPTASQEAARTETAARIAPPKPPGRPGKVRDQLTRWVANLVTHIRQGDFPLRPRSKDCTATCDYSQVCRITQSRAVEKTWDLPLPMIS